VRGDQRGIEVDDQRCRNLARAEARAVSIAARTARVSEARAVIVRDTVGSEATDPNTPRLGPQHRHIRETVTPQGESHREVEEHLGRVVDRPRPSPPGQAGAQPDVQTRGTDGFGEQHPTGLTHRRHSPRRHRGTRVQTATLHHLEGAPSFWSDWPVARPILPVQGHLPAHDTTRDQLTRESPGLGDLLYSSLLEPF